LEDFLSLGKLDEGKVTVAPAPCALNEFIHETIDEVRGLLTNNQKIVYHHNGQISINTDKKLLKNILLNLMSNAVKFSPESAIVDVTSEVQGDSVLISVKDQGIGISKEDQQHLFTSFFRGSNAINIQGTGLGLHIVKRYLELLNGTAELKSEISKGTEITIKIPINLS
jgi:signal transduction histidine kinase